MDLCSATVGVGSEKNIEACDRTALCSGREDVTAMKKVLAIIEAATVTGPAKNLLGYARRSRASGIDFRILTYARSGTPRETQLSQAAAACNIPLLLIHEEGRFDLALIERLRAAIEEFNPDIVQTHNYKSH